MVSDRLRQVMLRAVGTGELVGCDVQKGRAEHPICGDLIELSMQVEAGRIAALRWLANGCPAAMAVTALAGELLPGTSLAAAATTMQAALVAHGGLAAHERHAEGLLLRALTAACQARTGGP